MSRFEVLCDLPEDLEFVHDLQPPDLGPVDFSHSFFHGLEYNWAEHPSGCITPVRNQHYANACYAFPAADCTYAAVCLEYEKSTEKRQSPFPILSAQEIINCVHEFFPISEEEKARWAEVVNPRFGYPSSVNKAFNYIKERGLCSEKHFPFEGVKGPCVISSKVKLKVYSDYTKITDREKILQCLGKQPLAVSIPFVKSLQLYDGKSVYKGPTKYEKEKIEAKRREGQVIPLHALQVVGWGYEDVEKKKLFYLCKNSWGRGWGHKGFIKVAKDVVESGRASYAHSTYFGVPKA